MRRLRPILLFLVRIVLFFWGVSCVFFALVAQVWWQRISAFLAAIALIYLSRKQMSLRLRAHRDDPLGQLAERLNAGPYLDVGNVSFLITAVKESNKHVWEVWVQGNCEGKHQLILDAATVQSTTGGYIQGPHLRTQLESQDDELVSFFVPRQQIDAVALRTVPYEVSASTTTENRGRRLRKMRGTLMGKMSASDPMTRMITRVFGVFGLIWSAVAQHQSVESLAIINVTFPE